MRFQYSDLIEAAKLDTQEINELDLLLSKIQGYLKKKKNYRLIVKIEKFRKKLYVPVILDAKDLNKTFDSIKVMLK